ncbi:MAG: hypothetical protein ACYDAO_04070 [Thermoplasmataceae archaeon]
MPHGKKIKETKCPFCNNFKGMFTPLEKCGHMKKLHEKEINTWLKNNLTENAREKLEKTKADPFCWAAGVLMAI